MLLKKSDFRNPREKRMPEIKMIPSFFDFVGEMRFFHGIEWLR